MLAEIQGDYNDCCVWLARANAVSNEVDSRSYATIVKQGKAVGQSNANRGYNTKTLHKRADNIGAYACNNSVNYNSLSSKKTLRL